MPENINLPLDKTTADPESTANDTKKQLDIETALGILSNTLSSKLTEYVGKRYDKEAEWIIAENQYSGQLDVIDDKKLAALRSTRVGELPTVNITRPKTNIAIARLQDVQFPLGGDFNFSIEATPMPELEELQTSTELMPGGEEAGTVGDAAQGAIKTAKDKAAKMELKIHDLMVEASWAK